MIGANDIEYAPSMLEFFLKPYLAYKAALEADSLTIATGHNLDRIAEMVGFKNSRTRARKKLEYFKRTAKERGYVSHKLRLKINHWQKLAFLDDMQTRKDIQSYLITDRTAAEWI